MALQQHLGDGRRRPEVPVYLEAAWGGDVEEVVAD
jgi:hypothetical protein